MLEREDITHLTKHWHKFPTPEVYREVAVLIEQFSRAESIAVFCAGISALALHTGNSYYKEFQRHYLIPG